MARASSAKKTSKKTISSSKKVIFGVIMAAILVGAFAVYMRTNSIKTNSVTTFDECVAKGNPIMESFPRQCVDDGKTFVESISMPPPDIMQIRKGTDFPLEIPAGNYIIENASEWREKLGDVPLDLEIDFSAKTVIVAVMGQQPSGGYGIELDQIVVDMQKLVFTFEETMPGESCFTSDVLTNPYQIITIDKTDQEIVFEKISRVEECS